MSNIDSDFRNKAKAVGQVTYGGRPQSPGFYNPDGSTASMDSRQMRAERAVAAGRGGATNPIRLGVGEIMPETAGRPSAPNFTLRGSVPAGNQLVPTDGFDPAMRGKTSPFPKPAPPPSPERVAYEARRVATEAASTGPFPKPDQGLGERLKAGYRATVAGPTVGDIGSKALGRAKDLLTSNRLIGAVGSTARFGARGIPLIAGAADAAGMLDVATDDKMGTADVAEQSGRLAGRWGAAGAGAGLGVKLGAAAGAFTGPAAPVAVPALSLVGGLVGGTAGYMGAEKIMDVGAGQTAPDMRSNGIVKKTLGLGDAATASTAADKGKHLDIISQGDPRYQQLMDTPNGGIVGQDELPSAKVARTTFQSNPFARQAAPEAELARQAGNFNQFEAPINAALADRVKAAGGVSSFRDAAAQALFNAKQGLNGSGVSVSDVNGTPTFTGDNRAGGGQLYRAADGSVTNDWSKTQQYADAIQRNAKDQDRLAELTRGAALSGDKEALARLTHGDQRLAGIAAEAGTEKSLRDAVKRGSRNAAMVLADMEKSKATQGMAQAELGLKRAALVGAQEDRDLNRQLRQDSLAARVAENQRAAAKDTRETAQARLTTLDKQLEQYATADGKVDGQKLARLRGLAANLQPSPGQSPEEFNKDVTTLTSLASKLDDGQGWFDKLTSQAGLGGTDLRRWGVNAGRRGGFVTDQGDHISKTQYNSLTDDEKAAFNKFFLKGGK